MLASIAVTTLCASSQQASADSYPSRRITFVVPYPAGGATDVLGPLACQQIAEAWKQTVVVENKSGGGGVVGNDYVAKAQPDGYTVLVAITQIIQAPSLVAKLPYDVFKDLAPVTQVGAVDDRSDGPRAAADQVGQGTGRSMPRRIPAMPYGTLRQRHDVASLRRTPQEDRQYRHDPHSLSRLGSAAERPARQHGDLRLSST